VGDGRGWWGTAGGRRKRAENNGKERKTAGDGRGRWGTAGHGPSLGCVGQVPGKTGRDDRMPPVLVLDSYLSGNFRKWPDGTTNCPVENTGSSLVTCVLSTWNSSLHQGPPFPHCLVLNFGGKTRGGESVCLIFYRPEFSISRRLKCDVPWELSLETPWDNRRQTT